MADEDRLTEGDYYDSGRVPVGENGAYKCPVCDGLVEGEKGESEICETCRWEDCGFQEDNPDYEGGANYLSLNQAREHWQKHRTRVPRR